MHTTALRYTLFQPWQEVTRPKARFKPTLPEITVLVRSFLCILSLNLFYLLFSRQDFVPIRTNCHLQMAILDGGGKSNWRKTEWIILGRWAQIFTSVATDKIIGFKLLWSRSQSSQNVGDLFYLWQELRNFKMGHSRPLLILSCSFQTIFAILIVAFN